MSTERVLQPIVVYLVERHPLEIPGTGPLFSWLHLNNDYRRELKGLIGEFQPDDLSVIVDDSPGGEAWKLLLENLLDRNLRQVITHLAPLTPAQRHQLIGLCAEVGTQLITPGDAGRNRRDEPDS